MTIYWQQENIFFKSIVKSFSETLNEKVKVDSKKKSLFFRFGIGEFERSTKFAQKTVEFQLLTQLFD